jgi:hypothetical protein
MTFVVRRGRRVATSLLSAGLAAILAAGPVLASTPVTVGYRDQTYGGGAFRPASDKPQSKLWYTDGSWFAGMFLFQTSPATPKSEYRIYRHDGAHSWTLTPTVVDTRDTSHADYLWLEASDTLYAISVPQIPNTVPTVAVDDGIKVFKYTYNATTNAYSAVAGFPKTIQNTASVPNVSRGGSPTATIALDSTGDLWATWLNSNEIRYSMSENGGETWSDPAQLPAQAGNSVVAGPTDSLNDSAAVIAFGAGSPDKIGIAWSDQDNVPSGSDNGFYFATINAGDDPTVGANWTKVKLPSLVPTNQDADGHINIKTTSDGSVYMVGKTGTDTAQCATNKNSVLNEFFARTPAGAWSVHLLGTVGDCNTRPQLVISEQLDTAYVFLTSPNGGGTVYRKSAPLSGPEAYKFRGAADQTVQRGTPFIKSATETLIDDPSTTKQVVTSATGIAVIANNLAGGSNVKYYLHNEMVLPAADTTDPVGNITLNGGAAVTSSTNVTASVSATDTGGSGVSLVRLSNSPTVSGGVLTTGTTYVYTSPIAWTLTAGEGPKTVYAQWRDSAGNWSAVDNDTITFDTSAPDTTPPNPPGAPKHTLGGPLTGGIPVRLTWTAGSDPATSPNSGVAGYRVQQSVNGGAFATIANTTGAGTTLDLMLSNTSKTYRYRVATRDKVGNHSTYATGPTFKAISYNESSTVIAYTGTWVLSDTPTYIGGKAKYSTRAGSTATASILGNRVGFLSRTGPTSGSARIYIDGVLKTTVNLYAPTTGIRKLVFTYSWSSIGNHKMKIVVVGTAGHPRVTLDQILVLR